MVTTDYLAFGYKLCKVELDPGDTLRHECKKYVTGDWYLVDGPYNPNLERIDYISGNYSWSEIALVVSGKIAVTPIHTMTPVFNTRGFCTVDTPYAQGLVKDEVVEPTVLFSVNPFANLDKIPVLPDVSVLRWTAGDIIEPPLRFFLADGSFKKGDVTYSNAGAYTLSSDNIEITSDCLGFIFN